MRRFLWYVPGIVALCVLAVFIGWQLGKIQRPSRVVLEGIVEDHTATTSDEAPVIPVSHMTLAGIFSNDHSWVSQLEEKKTITMIATGDVIPARSVNQGMITRNNFRWPFEKTAEMLRSADLTVINLETPLLTRCAPTIEGMVFCGDARVIDGFTYAGVDVATLGNNHIGNYYEAGVEETKKHLSDAGILPVSARAEYKEVKGAVFSFLAYNDIGSREAGVPWADEATVQSDIKEARERADVVIVSYHWGVEYVSEPTKRQRDLAHLAVDAGADVVLGNHPHWIQPVELYKDKFIVYAQGNFVFDQEWSEETKRGVIGRYTFYEGRLIDVEYFPIRIVDYGQPYFLETQASRVTLDTMRLHSERLAK